MDIAVIVRSAAGAGRSEESRWKTVGIDGCYIKDEEFMTNDKRKQENRK